MRKERDSLMHHAVDSMLNYASWKRRLISVGLVVSVGVPVLALDGLRIARDDPRFASASSILGNAIAAIITYLPILVVAALVQVTITKRFRPPSAFARIGVSALVAATSAALLEVMVYEVWNLLLFNVFYYRSLILIVPAAAIYGGLWGALANAWRQDEE
jgi:hypothetical protein